MARRWLWASWAEPRWKVPTVASRSKATVVGSDVPGGRGSGSVGRRPQLLRAPDAADADGDDGGAEGQGGGRLGGGQPRAGELHLGVDGQRVGVVAEQDGGAVFAEGPQPGQQQPGGDTGRGAGQADPQKRARDRCPRVAAASSSAGSRAAKADRAAITRNGADTKAWASMMPAERAGEPAVEEPADGRVRARPCRSAGSRSSAEGGPAAAAPRSQPGQLRRPRAGQAVGQRDAEEGDQAVETVALTTETHRAFQRPGGRNPGRSNGRSG